MRVNISSEGDRAFQALFNASLDAMLLADDSGHYLDANPAACQLFGLEREQIIGRCIQDFSAIEFDVEQAWQDFLDRGQEQGQFSLIRLDGEVREVDYTATAHLLPHVHLSILRDITPESPPQPVSEAPGADERLERIACHVPGIIYQFCLDPDGTMSFPYTSELFETFMALALGRLNGIVVLYLMSSILMTSNESINPSRTPPPN